MNCQLLLAPILSSSVGVASKFKNSISALRVILLVIPGGFICHSVHFFSHSGLDPESPDGKAGSNDRGGVPPRAPLRRYAPIESVPSSKTPGFEDKSPFLPGSSSNKALPEDESHHLYLQGLSLVFSLSLRSEPLVSIFHHEPVASSPVNTAKWTWSTLKGCTWYTDCWLD